MLTEGISYSELLRSGIYRIRNVINNKGYIGSAVVIANRRDIHVCTLRAGTHYNGHLQRAFNAYGEENFVFEVLQFCSEPDLIVCEQKWMDRKRTYNPRYGYNIRLDAASNLGTKRSEESRLRSSVSLKRVWSSDELRSKARDSQNRPEVRARKSEVMKAIKGTPEARAQTGVRSREAYRRPERYKKFKETYLEKLRVKAVAARDLLGKDRFTERELSRAIGYIRCQILIDTLIKAGIVKVYAKAYKGSQSASVYCWVDI